MTPGSAYLHLKGHRFWITPIEIKRGAQMPNEASPAKRITVQIPAPSGDAIEAWVYRPEGSGPRLPS
jgi:dipeptidyl aminopeptidase/acylaminoacyl peptidase